MRRLTSILVSIIFLTVFTGSLYAWDESGWDQLKVPFVRKTAAPTVDDSAFGVPFLWVDETNDKFYILIDNTPGAAVWQEVTYAGGSPSFATVDLTGVPDTNIPTMQAAGAGFGDSPLWATDASTVTLKAATGQPAVLALSADAAEDNSDKWRVSAADGGDVTLETYQSGAWVVAATWTNSGGYTVTGALAGATLNTGQGAYELYAMNQDVESTDAVTFATVDTGQGANELYDMDQNVLTTSSPTFAGVVTPAITAPAASLVIKPTTDAVTAVQVQDKDGNAVLTVDTVSNLINANDGNITNVGDIAVDTISSDAGTSVGVTLGSDSGDNFNVGSGKLVVEGDTGRVGIGTSAPSTPLHIFTTGPNLLRMQVDYATDVAYGFYMDSGGFYIKDYMNTKYPFLIAHNAPDNALGITSSGNIGLGQTTFGTSAAKVLAIGSGTAPTTSPADAVQLWSADHNSAAGYARLYQRTEDGLTGPVAQLAEVTDSVNPKAMSQAVNMTAASSGSTGITISDDDDLDMGTGNFTLPFEGSIPDWTPSSDAILAQKTDGTNGWILQIDTTGVIQVVLNTTTYSSTVAPSPEFTANSVHKIVAVITRESASTAGSIVFYVDKKPIGASVAITAGAPTTVSNASSMYVLGTSAVRTAGVVHFFGLVNRAMTAAEVKSLYENGIDFADKWGSQTDLVLNSTDWTGATGATPPNSWVTPSAAVFTIADEGGDHTTALKIEVNATPDINPEIRQTITTVPGKNYRLSYSYKFVSGTSARVDLGSSLGGIDISSVSGTSATWTDVSTNFVAVGTSTYLKLRIMATTAGQHSFFDSVSITPIGFTAAWEPEGIRNDGWQDSSTNGLDASYPTVGSSLAFPIPTTNGAILLSGTTVSLAADADTTLYTVPTGKRCVLSHAVLIAGADAVSTDISIGADGAETDFVSAYQCDNLDAENDAIIITPVPATTPVKIKSYAGGTAIQAKVENHAGGATNYIYLFGFLY